MNAPVTLAFWWCGLLVVYLVVVNAPGDAGITLVHSFGGVAWLDGGSGGGCPGQRK